MTYEHRTLLPRDSTPYELTISDVCDDFANLDPDFENVHSAILNPPSQFFPWLVWQYGLGELYPFLPNLFQLITQGVHWQRLRGTPAAIALGLSWLGYAGSLDEVPTRRLIWNRFQWALDRVRDNDYPDLPRIDGIVSLSPPLRSIFWRCYNGYDVRAQEWSYRRWSDNLWGTDSGVRIPQANPLWSFGRNHDVTDDFSQADLTALGVWIPPVTESGLWVDDSALWVTEGFLWSNPAAVARRKEICDEVSAMPCYVLFKDAGGAVIGASAATVRGVMLSSTGEYVVSGSGWTSKTSTPTAVLVHARTPFGSGNGHVAATASLLFSPTLAGGAKPGTVWLTPAQFSGGTVVASHSMSITFGLTVRERVRFVLRV